MTARSLTGYAARWTLLVSTVLLIIGSLAASLAATVNLIVYPDSQIHLSDTLQFGPEHTREDLLGHVQSGTDRWEVPYILVRTGGGRVEIQEVQTDNYLILHFNDHIVGLARLTVSGLPYGQEALARWPVDVYGVEPGEKVVFVDTAMFISPTDEEHAALDALLAAADSHGLAVMLSGGLGEQFFQRDQLAAQVAPGRLHLSTHPWSSNAVLRTQFRQRMTDYGIAAQLITAEWEAALSASNAGFDAHYIAISPQPIPTDIPEDGPPKRWQNVTIYRSLEEFLEYYGR